MIILNHSSDKGKEATSLCNLFCLCVGQKFKLIPTDSVTQYFPKIKTLPSNWTYSTNIERDH